MKKILLTTCAVVLLSLGWAWAQERTVSGRVTDATDGSNLPGVNVTVKGTTRGTVSGADGSYSISIPNEGATLVFTFIGLVTQEIEVGDRSTINVAMQTDVTQLTEIVVTGYGVQDKRTLTSSITKVDGAKLSALTVNSFDQALVGQAAGVQVTVASGLVGEAPRIRIRGTNSITSGADPLIVIDGVPMISGNQSGVAPSNPLGDINPADIQSFEILKDGAATAIYGSRAANGVILITTKTGRSGQPRVSYEMQFGTNNVARKFDVLNADEFIRISNEKFAASGLMAPQALPGPGNVDTDWQDVIFRTGKIQTHNLNISGGSEQFTYYFSAGWTKQEGAVVNNEFERYTMRANIDYNGVKWLAAGLKVALSRQVNNGLNTGTNSLSGNVTNALASFPNVPVYDDTHPTGYNITADNRALGRGNNLQDIASSYTNIQYVLDKNKQEADNYRILPNGYLQVNVIDGLNVRTQLGADISDNEDFLTWDPIHGDGGGSTQGIVYRGNRRVFRWNWQNTINFKKTFAEVHNVGITIGNEFQKTTLREFFGQGTTFSDPVFLQYDLISGTYATQESGGDFTEDGFESNFGRVNYDYKGKYLLSASFRRDAISKIPTANRVGTFPGFSAGWVVTEEPFFNLAVLSELKIRGSYAEVGNTALGNFSYVGTYGPELYGTQTAIRFSQVGNSSLRWETSKKIDFGIDFGLFNGRVSGSVDYFKNDVSDLILNAPTPFTAGIPGNQIAKNVGTLVNSGIEVMVSTDNLSSADLKWTTDITFTSQKNEITALNNDEDIIFTYTINRVGESMSSIYGYEYAGVNPANGNPLYVKGDGTLVQGNVDTQSYFLYNPEDPADVSQATTALSATSDRKILGQTMPKWFGGINNRLSYKGFDFELFLTYSGGNKIMNVTRQANMDMVFKNNISEILNRWTPENPNTDVPRLYYNRGNFLNLTSSAVSRFVEDGDFLRIQNISLGYNLPKATLSSFANGALNNVRVYAQVRNAFVFTKYKGADPELNFSNTTNSQFGVDNNTNPLLRTFTFGLNVGF